MIIVRRGTANNKWNQTRLLYSFSLKMASRRGRPLSSILEAVGGCIVVAVRGEITFNCRGSWMDVVRAPATSARMSSWIEDRERKRCCHSQDVIAIVPGSHANYLGGRSPTRREDSAKALPATLIGSECHKRFRSPTSNIDCNTRQRYNKSLLDSEPLTNSSNNSNCLTKCARLSMVLLSMARWTNLLRQRWGWFPAVTSSNQQ